MKLSLSIHKNRILLLPALLALALGLWLAVPPVFCAGAVLCLAAAGLIRIRATGRHAWLLPALAACAASLMTVVLVQIANETIRLVPIWKLLLGAVCALLPMLLLYLPLSFLPKNGGRIAIGLTSGLLLILGVLRERMLHLSTDDGGNFLRVGRVRLGLGYDFVFFIADDKRLIRIDFFKTMADELGFVFFRMCADLAFDGVCGSGSHPKHKGMPSIREAGNID